MTIKDLKESKSDYKEYDYNAEIIDLMLVNKCGSVIGEEFSMQDIKKAELFTVIYRYRGVPVFAGETSIPIYDYENREQFDCMFKRLMDKYAISKCNDVYDFSRFKDCLYVKAFFDEEHMLVADCILEYTE